MKSLKLHDARSNSTDTPEFDGADDITNEIKVRMCVVTTRATNNTHLFEYTSTATNTTLNTYRKQTV